VNQLAGLRKSSPAVIYQLVRFGLVGGGSSLVYFGVSLSIHRAGVALELAHLTGLAVSLLTSFLGHKLFTFRQTARTHSSGLRFVIATAGISIAQTLLVAGANAAGSPDIIILAASTAFYPLTSVFVHTLWTFKPSRPPNEKPVK
jgi:putative flippase GtrA